MTLWRSQWGLQFQSTNGDVQALEQSFWESRAASHQATAAVLSAGALLKASQPRAGANRGVSRSGRRIAAAAGALVALDGPATAAAYSPRPPPPTLLQASHWCTAC